MTAGLLDPRFQNLTVVNEHLRKGTMCVEFLADQIAKYVKAKDVQHQRVACDESDIDKLTILTKRHLSSNSKWSSQLALECHILFGTKCSFPTYWNIGPL